MLENLATFENEIDYVNNKLILKFGIVNIPTDSRKIINFKTPFKNKCLVVFTTGADETIGDGTLSAATTASRLSKTSFQITNDNLQMNIYWIAIGY
ncbi:gp53-like domain-containing protein [Fusobacterium gastrosuis]|uniref:gp53-like domain-containing protein n=1 Tax=Fusobacterium gastrosuis TaxID=1755100 RepID=UPI002970E841|nr:hypothetical protein [Fusobacteriaceae bacterium]MDY5713624.1 hypothetical protein [Fusobacterium gastrosuis]